MVSRAFILPYSLSKKSLRQNCANKSLNTLLCLDGFPPAALFFQLEAHEQPDSSIFMGKTRYTDNSEDEMCNNAS